MATILEKSKNILEFYHEQKHDNRIYLVVFLFIFSLMFVLNYLHPIGNDDWVYSFIVEQGFPDKVNPSKIESFSDFISSQVTHYHIWGGRTVAHVVVQFLLLLDVPLRAFLNSLMFVLLILGIIRVSNLKEKKTLAIVIVFLLLWFLQPGFVSSVLWITGSGNYLWTTTLILFFLLPFAKSYLSGNFKERSPLFSSFLFIGGIVAGWSNENMAVAISLVGIFYIVYLKSKRIKVPLWILLGGIGFIIGCLFLIMAPGNRVRMGNELMLANPDGTNYIFYFFKRIKALFVVCLFEGLVAIFSYVLVLITYSFCKKDQADNKKLNLSIFFFVTALLATLIMGASPVFPTRAWFGIVSFIIVAILLLYAELDFKKYLPLRVYSNALLIFFFVLFFGQYVYAVRDLSHLKNVYDEREQIVKEEKEKGNRNIIFHNHVNMETDFSHIKDLDMSPDNWKNKLYSIYHNLDSVRIEPY